MTVTAKAKGLRHEIVFTCVLYLRLFWVSLKHPYSAALRLPFSKWVSNKNKWEQIFHEIWNICFFSEIIFEIIFVWNMKMLFFRNWEIAFLTAVRKVLVKIKDIRYVNLDDDFRVRLVSISEVSKKNWENLGAVLKHHPVRHQISPQRMRRRAYGFCSSTRSPSVYSSIKDGWNEQVR